LRRIGGLCDRALIDKLIADNAFYRTATVPGGMYKGTDDTITTFGVGATFITSTDVSEKAVYPVVKGVFDNFADFKKLHPTLTNLEEAQMIQDGLSAPLRAGAVKHYKQRGWMN
jgi:uncharacterized protein